MSKRQAFVADRPRELEYPSPLYVTDRGQLSLGQGASTFPEEVDRLAAPVRGKKFPVLAVLSDDLCVALLRHAADRSSTPGAGRKEHLLECGPDEQQQEVEQSRARNGGGLNPSTHRT
ncbi:hypothetical protein [Brachybacterium sacelli]|uniref:hypothetical protein n=1 Tax=Brachybacterium sacelli TaxID=173364 RepID=UPI003614D012